MEDENKRRRKDGRRRDEETKRRRDEETKRRRDEETKRRRDEETKRQRDEETKRRRDEEGDEDGIAEIPFQRKEVAAEKHDYKSKQLDLLITNFHRCYKGIKNNPIK